MPLVRPAPPSNGSATRPPDPGPRRRTNPLSTRRGTLAIAAIAALIALGALLFFLNQYRNSVADSEQVSVLVADEPLSKGMPGHLVAEEELYSVDKVPRSEAVEGAIGDPEALTDKLVVSEIYPGEQLQAADFEASDGDVRDRLTGYRRAVTVPVDPVRGMIGNVGVGDTVDVIATFKPVGTGAAVASYVARDALVVALPPEPAESSSGNSTPSANQPATLRISDDSDALPIASGADSGKIWLVLRPAVDDREHSKSVDSVATVLEQLEAEAP